MRKQVSLVKLIFFSILGILVGAAVTVLILARYLGGMEMFPIAAKFTTAYDIIDREFIGEADMDEVLTATYRAMVGATGDRWSMYMTPEEYESYHQSSNNAYTGIGITVSTDNDGGYPEVLQVTKNSPAAEAGIVPGDKICRFDGKSLEGAASGELKSLITEKNGEEFVLTLIGENGAERAVVLKAGEIYTDPVEYEMLPGGIAYIRIVNFERGSGESGINAVEELMRQGAEGIIFDVRNNPGGFLRELTELLDFLLPEGEMFVSVDEDGNEVVTRSDAGCVELPMAVLMNGYSYSAAEFFAAALNEYDLAFTVGEHTTGKSRSQVNLFLPDGSAIHLSTNGYLTPNRVDLAEQGGLTPDYEVKMDKEKNAELILDELDQEDDGQLQKAVELLSEQLGRADEAA